MSFRNRTGLDHCRRLDTNNVIYQLGQVLKSDTDAESYHLITRGEVDWIEVQEYWVETQGQRFTGLPGSRLPIIEGSRFGARLKLRHRYLGGNFIYHMGINIGGSGADTQIAAVSFTLPTSLDRIEYTVEAVSDAGTGNFKNRTGLAHCRLLDVNNVIYAPDGSVAKADGDAECYHLQATTEVKALRAQTYWSDSGSGAPGAKVPIEKGNAFGSEMTLEYRYLGGNWTVLSELNVEGVLERAFVDFSLLYSREWQTVKVKTSSVSPFDPRGLGEGRVIDVKNTLWYRGPDWSRWDLKIEDWDQECYAVKPGAPPESLPSDGFVTVYEHINFQGRWQKFKYGVYADLRSQPIGNDVISSVKVSPGYGVALYENDNMGGAMVKILQDVPDLRALNFNDRASSLIVEWGEWL